ncbi:nitroreductase family protein [Porticoccaceae bacterium LTM1]|nr:nitroreductase family protein [Porticoccaceae bacterium LTM1]
MRDANTEFAIHSLIKQRYSPYQFSPERLVADADLAAMLEAARWAASSFNAQPWRYIIAKREDKEDFEQILGCLTEKNRIWAQHAGVLALGFSQLNFEYNGKPNRVAIHDLGAASAQLTLEAENRGLKVHQMAGILQDVIREKFQVPDDFEPVTAIAVGYAEENPELPDDVRQKDSKTRERKSVSDFVFANAWGQPADLEPGGGA